MGSESQSCTKDSAFETRDLRTFFWEMFDKGEKAEERTAGSQFQSPFSPDH